MSTRKIAASIGVGQSTASEYVKRVQQAGLTWPFAAEMTDVALEALLFRPIGGPTRLSKLSRIGRRSTASFVDRA